MKIAYFDCSSGIAGNMILGALINAGLKPKYLKSELSKLGVRNWKLEIIKTKRQGIQGTHVEVKIKGKEKPRRLNEILTIIKKSKLSKNVKNLSSRIFQRLAEAESKVHGEPVGYVHLHEVGAIDAMLDIIGTAIGIEKLGIQKVYCSPLPHGRGSIKHKHGILPNPAPATVELLKGIPTYGTNIKGELVTPTGAAIISTLAKGFGDLPRMEVKDIGYGAGSLNLSIPNLLRLFVGEAQLPSEKDAILQIETNLDDMHPKHFNKVIAAL
ncbi:MAG: nickel pincer cofactor biosynthesis protein LarC, partial [Candidatus Margulisiibacteriota bacterium]